MELYTASAIVLCVFGLVSAQQQTDPNEVAALTKIIEHWSLEKYLNLTIDPCTQNASWAPDNANPRIACDCSSNTCHITHLKIYALDIAGTIPSELFQLKELIDLNLAQNILTGPIPAEIRNLAKMQFLSFGINNLSGPVPPELGNMTRLISLSFSSNSFNGQLPNELGQLKSLKQLYIDSSGVRGTIPEELGNLKSLQKLWASDNLFTGKLPKFIGTLTELVDLRLEGTLLEGPIPASFGALKNLDTLLIGDLHGEDSTLTFLENQTSLSVLSLRSCQLSGEIPEHLGTFSKLIYLDLSFNKLTGQIPASFQSLTAIKYMLLGNNNLSGQLPTNIITSQLMALDVSFNPLDGSLPSQFGSGRLNSTNIVGTLISANKHENRKAFEMLQCINAKCTMKAQSTSFSVNCGGKEQASESGFKYEDDSEQLGAASFYTSTNNQWGVSNSGKYIFSSQGAVYIDETESQIIGTLESELYKTARVSPSSLRYYGLGLKNGLYSVDLHFAEIIMEDHSTWKALGRRLFDVYIQGDRVVQDFNIQEEAGGTKRALVKSFQANVTNMVMDIHLLWAGKGTCCIPAQSTYGPLISAIHVSQVKDATGLSSESNNKHLGKILGITFGCIGALVIILSGVYLWWTKDASGHMRVATDSPRK